MLVVGAISAGLLSFITTTTRNTVPLERIRNRQYAADGAIEAAIARERVNLNAPAADACGNPAPPPTPIVGSFALDGFTIRVDCSNARKLVVVPGVGLVDQINVILWACEDTGVVCSEATTIVRAQVNFAKAPTADVARTYIQAWSVNR
ncbi:MAG: hypothetical protein ABJD24_16765 [Acidimicrobiales bacterium]